MMALSNERAMGTCRLSSRRPTPAGRPRLCRSAALPFAAGRTLLPMSAPLSEELNTHQWLSVEVAPRINEGDSKIPVHPTVFFCQVTVAFFR
jgi:hypothetical protein